MYILVEAAAVGKFQAGFFSPRDAFSVVRVTDYGILGSL